MNYLSSKFNFERTENILSVLLSKIKENKNYLDLTTSNPTLFFRYELDKIQFAYSSKTFFPYEPNPHGILDARLALVEYYKQKGRNMKFDNFIFTSGTSEAMSFILKVICDFDSEIILPTPGYPLYDFILKIENVLSKHYLLLPKKTESPNKLIWEIDFQHLEQSITNSTKAIVIVEPHNPTGSRITQEDALRLKELARKYNLILIIDEVFSDYYENYYLVNSFTGANCIFLNGLSKTLALPQLKLSWIYLDGDLNFINQMMEALEIVSDTYLSVNIPVQRGLKILLETAGLIQKEILNRIQANCNHIKSVLQNESSIDYYLPDGGWYLLLKINKDIDDEEFACNLLKNKFVYVHPGYMFDMENGCYIVISLIIPEDIFMEGIKRMVHFVNENFPQVS